MPAEESLLIEGPTSPLYLPPPYLAHISPLPPAYLVPAEEGLLVEGHHRDQRPADLAEI